MDEFGFIFFVIFLILSIVIISKINSLGKEIRSMNERIKALMTAGTQQPHPVPEEVVVPAQNTEVPLTEGISEVPVVYEMPEIPAKDVSIAAMHADSHPITQECMA